MCPHHRTQMAVTTTTMLRHKSEEVHQHLKGVEFIRWHIFLLNHYPNNCIRKGNRKSYKNNIVTSKDISNNTKHPIQQLHQTYEKYFGGTNYCTWAGEKNTMKLTANSGESFFFYPKHLIRHETKRLIYISAPCHMII